MTLCKDAKSKQADAVGTDRMMRFFANGSRQHGTVALRLRSVFRAEHAVVTGADSARLVLYCLAPHGSRLKLVTTRLKLLLCCSAPDIANKCNVGRLSFSDTFSFAAAADCYQRRRAVQNNEVVINWITYRRTAVGECSCCILCFADARSWTRSRSAEIKGSLVS